MAHDDTITLELTPQQISRIEVALDAEGRDHLNEHFRAKNAGQSERADSLFEESRAFYAVENDVKEQRREQEAAR